ncbi:MAG: hypothetical protein ACK5PF_08235 [bacterium]
MRLQPLSTFNAASLPDARSITVGTPRGYVATVYRLRDVDGGWYYRADLVGGGWLTSSTARGLKRQLAAFPTLRPEL